LTNEYDITFAASPKTYVQALACAGAAPVLIPMGISDDIGRGAKTVAAHLRWCAVHGRWRY
jgi:hypothetical protein